MRILFICENYLPHYGGAEVLFKNLAERFVQQGHKVTILTHRLRGTPKKENINGVTVQRISCFFSRYLFTFLALFQAIRLAKRHDIIQTTSFNGAPPAWVAGLMTEKPVVITVHEVWIGRWKEITGFSAWKSALHEILERAIYALPYDRYVCVSEATKNDLLRIGIDKKKVERIYNGFDYEFWNPQNFDNKRVMEIRKNLGLEGKWVYFSWGRPGVSKGFEYGIKALPLVRKKIPNAVFLLMLGSAEKYKENVTKIRRLIQRLKLTSKNVKIIPSVPYEDLGHYILAADCVVIPSVSEGFGYAALEAASMDMPVVVSNAGSLPEVIGGRYQLFKSKDPNNLAEGIIKTKQKQYQISKKKYYYWNHTLQSYYSAYICLTKNNENRTNLQLKGGGI